VDGVWRKNKIDERYDVVCSKDEATEYGSKSLARSHNPIE